MKPHIIRYDRVRGGGGHGEPPGGGGEEGGDSLGILSPFVGRKYFALVLLLLFFVCFVLIPSENRRGEWCVCVGGGGGGERERGREVFLQFWCRH